MLQHDDVLPIHPWLLHPLTGEPLQALGLRADGRPVWPILGGADDDDQDDDAGDDTDDDDQDDDAGDDTDDEDEDEELGPAGKKALAAERAKNKKLRARLRAAKGGDSRQERRPGSERGRDGRGKDDRRNDRSKDTRGKDEDRDEEDIREEVRRELQAETDRKLIKSAVIAGASTKLANPKLAGRLLDLDQFELDEDGEIDEDELNEALDDLLEENPGLARSSRRRDDDEEDDEDDDRDRGRSRGGRDGRRSSSKFRGGADGGARGGGKDKAPASLAEAIEQRLTESGRRGGGSTTRRRSNR